VSPVKYEVGFYIPEDDILHSHCRENLKSYIHQQLLLNSILMPAKFLETRILYNFNDRHDSVKFYKTNRIPIRNNRKLHGTLRTGKNAVM
jgi:hypothetical protein